MKTLSVRQPWATLICSGIKTVENRTWKTDYRGKLLIHASGNSLSYPDFRCLPKSWQKKMMEYADSGDWSEASEGMLNYCELLRMTYEFYGQDYDLQEPPETWHEEAVKKHGFFMPCQAIIGEVTLSDIADNLYDANDDWCEKDSAYYWKLTDPILYEGKEIKTNVIGRLRLWDFES